MKLNNKMYNVLKYVALIGLPALSTLYSVLAAIWNLPFADEIPKTIAAIGVFLGSLLMISTASYNKDKNSI